MSEIEKKSLLNQNFKMINDRGEDTREKLLENLFFMLNQEGRHIFCMLQGGGTISKIYKDYVKDMKGNFTNLCNNSELAHT